MCLHRHLNLFFTDAGFSLLLHCKPSFKGYCMYFSNVNNLIMFISSFIPISLPDLIYFHFSFWVVGVLFWVEQRWWASFGNAVKFNDWDLRAHWPPIVDHLMHIAYGTGKHFLDLANSNLIGLLYVISQSKGTHRFISVQLKRNLCWQRPGFEQLVKL